MHTQKLLLNIPDNLVEQIDHYKDIAKEPSRSKTIIDLLKYALTLPPYFKDFDWQKAEAEADEAIKKKGTDLFSCPKSSQLTVSCPANNPQNDGFFLTRHAGDGKF